MLRSLSHSMETAAQYYQAPSQANCLQTFDTIQCLIGDRGVQPNEDCTTSSVPPRPRKGQDIEQGKGKGKRRAIISTNPSPNPAMKGRRAVISPSTSPTHPRRKGQDTTQGQGKGKRRAVISPSPSPSPAANGSSSSSSPTPWDVGGVQMGKWARSPVHTTDDTSEVCPAISPFSPQKWRKFTKLETAAVSDYFGRKWREGNSHLSMSAENSSSCTDFLAL